MKGLLFSLVCLSLPSFAAVPAHRVTSVKDFYLESNVGFGDKVYYNCSDVESRVSQFLGKLGATNIQVQCTGGIDPALPPAAWEANVRMSYQTLRLNDSGESQPVSADWKNVNFNSFGSCYLYSQLFEETKETFEMNETARVSHCTNSDSSFRLQLKTLF